MSSFLHVMAIPIAAIASWLAGACWYGIFGDRWMAALDKTRADLVGPSGKPSPLPFAFSFLAELVMATVLAILIGRLGAVSAAGGLGVGILAWVGFVATALGVNHAYSGAKPALSLIDGGHWLLVLLIQGFIIGAFAAG